MKTEGKRNLLRQPDEIRLMTGSAQTELSVFILQFNKHGRPNALRTLFTAVIILPDAPNPVSMPTLSFKFRHLLHFSLHSNMSFLFISMLF